VKKKIDGANSRSAQETHGDNTIDILRRNRAKLLVEDGKTGIEDLKSKLLKQQELLRSDTMSFFKMQHITRRDRKADEDWEQVTDAKSGKKYWWNKDTNKTSWKNPRAESSDANNATKTADVAHALTAKTAWIRIKDPKGGRDYHWNSLTQAVRWNLRTPKVPRGAAGGDAGVAADGGVAHVWKYGEKAMRIRRATNARDAAGGIKDEEPEDDAHKDGDAMEVDEAKAEAIVAGGNKSGNQSESKPFRFDFNRKNAPTSRKPGFGSRRRRREEDDTVDPLDPTGRGGRWSQGLAIDGERMADSTASGPLFQQRPYPAPGKILAKKKKKDAEKRASMEKCGPQRQ